MKILWPVMAVWVRLPLVLQFLKLSFMTAKELAEKLLEYPEYTVYAECAGRDVPLHNDDITVNDFIGIIYLGY